MSQDWKTILLTPRKSVSQKIPVQVVNVFKPATNNNPDSSKATMKKYKDEDGNIDEVPIKIDKSFGLEMQKARMRLNLTQEKLANALSLPVSVINKYEKGQGIKVDSNISKIKKFLDI